MVSLVCLVIRFLLEWCSLEGRPRILPAATIKVYQVDNEDDPISDDHPSRVNFTFEPLA